MDRRKFLWDSLLTGTFGLSTFSDSIKPGDDPNSFEKSEILYNGISLPEQWPPKNMDPSSHNPMPVPYLESPPGVIPIDVGRQLFVDDFLIEYSNLEREFHQPDKLESNPILTSKTKVEMNKGYCPSAAPFSDGCFYDPNDQLFKLYYQAGWFDGIALAVSSDGINWERPDLDVVPGTNLVIAPRDHYRRDGVSVWLDHQASNPEELYKMYLWVREGEIGTKLDPVGGFLLSSPDGIHWDWRGKIGETGDNSTFFYNPFRDVWAFTVRRFGRPAPPWNTNPWNGAERGRARSYWENKSFWSAIDGWDNYDPVFWLGADRLDRKRENYSIGREPQIYKVDAVGYESLMIGLIQIHYGPPNNVCAQGGFPKLTELQIAFSRDGFHWDRSCRETFLGATLDKTSWERAYIHSVGGVCNIVNDKLHFYYTGFQGDETNLNTNPHWNGMYANASTGLAKLRRDGFASMKSDNVEKILLTRAVKFNGKYLFVNIKSTGGKFRAEICQKDGTAISGFTRDECKPISTDSTKHLVKWKNKESIESLIGEHIRFKFYSTNSNIYAFWVSQNREGTSDGATAAGGPGLTGTWNT